VLSSDAQMKLSRRAGRLVPGSIHKGCAAI
jgi:hypothetical protein